MTLQQSVMTPSRVAPSSCNGGGPMTLQKSPLQWPHEAAIRHHASWCLSAPRRHASHVQPVRVVGEVRAAGRLATRDVAGAIERFNEVRFGILSERRVRRQRDRVAKCLGRAALVAQWSQAQPSELERSKAGATITTEVPPEPIVGRRGIA